MKLLILCGLLLPAVIATSFGSTSMVITSKDVATPGFNTKTLKNGQEYRIYAVYAPSAQNKIYASKVRITGHEGAGYTVDVMAEISRTVEFPYELDPYSLIAPISINDTLLATTNAPRFPYTIYIVSASVPEIRVLSAQYITSVQTFKKNFTVLSAEKAFHVTSSGKISVKTAGYDADSSYDVTTSSDANVGRKLVISGPIATVYNSNNSSDFQFDVATEHENYAVVPGISTVFLSSGWLNKTHSYNTDYNDDNKEKTRKYDFGRDTDLNFTFDGEFKDKMGAIPFICTRTNGSISHFLFTSFEEDHYIENGTSCRWIEVFPHGKTVARYVLKIDSGTFSASIFVLLIASIVRGLLQ